MLGILALALQFCAKKGHSPQTSNVHRSVFRDDFRDNSKIWYQKNNDSVYVNINSDSLFFTNKTIYPSYCIAQSVLIDEEKNFSIKASIKFKEGIENFGYGITWGRKNWDNFYSFLISKNGTVRVVYVINGYFTPIQDWVYSGYVNSKINEIEVRKEGSQYLFRINGNTLVKKPYQPLLGNDIGFHIDNNLSISVDYVDVTQW